MVDSSTARLRSTTPMRRRLRGMRTLPTSGHAMNHVPPPMRNTAATAIAMTLETCVARKTVMTGPMIQMISCAEASSENSGVSCREVTIFG